MKKIHCDVIRDLLPLYVDNAASTSTLELVREHLKTCPQCREELEMMCSLVTLPPDEDAGQVLEKFRAKKDKLRRWRKIGIFCALAAVILFCLWYTRPMTLAELYPHFDWTACSEIKILDASYQLDIVTLKEEKYQFTLTPDDPDFARMLSKFQNKTFRRSLLGLLPREPVRIHGYREGDIYWELFFDTDAPLKLENYFGELYIFEYDTGKEIRCTTPDLDQWLSDVMDIIRTHSDTAA